MSNEELLKMYEAIKADPGELVRAAARKRLINFARYMQPDLPCCGGCCTIIFRILPCANISNNV